MKIAHFDCQFGAAGDMLLAAMLHAGLPETEWLAELKKIALAKDSFAVSVSNTVRLSIACKKVEVACAGGDSERHLAEIVEIIEKSKISQAARSLAIKIFTRLAEAEGKVHGISPEEVHFHEVGAIDAIVDIVGFAIGFDLLGIEHATISPVPLGSGVTKTEHGLFPVPPPAVLHLLAEAQAPTRASEIDYECLTPTGAAILTTIGAAWGFAPAIDKINSIGYGAGTKESQLWPNVVRLVLGESERISSSHRFDEEPLFVVEANIDDFSPQALSYAVDRLFEAGALDVAVIPAVMKKGRSGQILSVLTEPGDRSRIQELILAETSSIGVRSHQANRLVAEREWKQISLPRGGNIRIKVALDKSGTAINAQPEFEDCAAYAAAHSLPLKQVIAEAISAYLDSSNSKQQGRR